MPARPTRRRADPNAGPEIVDERTTTTVQPSRPVGGLRAQLEAGRRPAATPEVPAERARKFTALLDGTSERRFRSLTRHVVDECGPIASREGKRAGGYDPSRADVLRALLALVDNDPQLRARVVEQVRDDCARAAH